jgi:hypothetical protein
MKLFYPQKNCLIFLVTKLIVWFFSIIQDTSKKTWAVKRSLFVGCLMARKRLSSDLWYRHGNCREGCHNPESQNPTNNVKSLNNYLKQSWPTRGPSNCSINPQKLVIFKKNQQNHWNYRKIWPSMGLFCRNVAFDLTWVGRRCFKIFQIQIQILFFWNRMKVFLEGDNKQLSKRRIKYKKLFYFYKPDFY